jgi:hypothetical protein
MSRTSGSALLFAVGAVALLVALAGCAVDLDPDADPAEARASGSSAIVNGQATTAFPTTGILLYAGSPDSLVCSGTLIGCDRFLTAAHCVCFGEGTDCQGFAPELPLQVFLQNGGFFDVIGQHVHPDFSFPDSDVAVLELSRPAAGLLPSPLPEAAPRIGQDGVIVGFGRSGGGEQDYGIKQFGPIVTAECPADASGPGHVCWEFQGAGANTCNGDSGGPLFVEDLAGRLAVAGITSGGTRGDCLAGDRSYDNEVFTFVEYIAGVAGGAEKVGQATCGELPHLGEAGAAVASKQGSLEPWATATHVVEVPAGTAELRVSLNSTEGSNPDLFIRAGQAATEIAHDCAADGPSSYGFCEVRSPVPGTWHLLVRGVGAGEYQLTTTTLAGAPVAADDSYETSVGPPLAVHTTLGLLANDAEVGRGPLTAAIDRPPAHGKVDLRSDGSFTYHPAAGFSGEDSFTYRASDGVYAGAATVALTVADPPPPEAEADDRADGDEDGAGEDPDGSGCAAGGSPSPAGAWMLLGLILASRLRRSWRHPAVTGPARARPRRGRAGGPGPSAVQGRAAGRAAATAPDR